MTTKQPPDDPGQDNILDRIKVTDIASARRKKTQPKPPGPAPEPQGMLQHFQPLGYDGDQFYFFTSRGKQIRSLSASKLGKKIELLTLAPLEWWEREYSGEQGFSGRAVEMAANHLIQQCYGRGVFCPDSRRGRGVWVDYKDSIRRIVIHAGDRLYIDGAETPLLQTATTHVYEQAPAISISMRDPLSVEEARPFVTWCKELNWERRTYGMLLAGWTVASVASGALVWRPHGLVTGPKGCGKSWDMHVLSAVLGNFCLAATGGSSAAGLRQSLQSDALPVLFDEAEGDSGRAQDNIAAVLGLMRHSSAALDAKVFKGGADGKASTSIVRSCFLLAAIRDPLIQAADKSRVTVFSLKPATHASAVHWRTKLRPLADIITSPGYAERLRGRIFSRIGDLLDSIEIFSGVCATKFGDQRMGDQIGALLGGVWLLTQDGVPTVEDATSRVNRMEWSDQNDLLTESSDEMACLQSILEAHVRVDGERWHGDSSIGELIEVVRKGFPGSGMGGLEASEAERSLGIYGIKVVKECKIGDTVGCVYVSNTNGMLARKVMTHTPWPQGWGKLLARIPGAVRAGTVKIAGHGSRVVGLPFAILDGESDEEGSDFS